MKREHLISFFVGLVFAIGLGLAGMTQPQKVIGFLSLTEWDPTLLFVMAGAVLFHSIAYQFIKNKPSPLFASKWLMPKNTNIDKRLLVGAAIFGAGWGLGGFCPGPALTSIVTFDSKVLLFVGFMLIGMIVFIRGEKLFESKGR